MSNDIFTVHKFEIEAKKLNEPFYLIPFGDVHRFAPLCHTYAWKEFLEWAKSKENAYFLGMGDFFDLASSSERQAIKVASLHESTMETLEELYQRQVDTFVKEIGFMRDRIVGMIEGNHHAEFFDGRTTTQEMCRQMGCKYLGVSSFIKLVVRHGTKTASVDIWAHHGRGGSRLSGGSINAVEQMMRLSDAQILLMGHDHRKSLAMVSKLTLLEGRKNLRLSQKKILLGRTGSFLKGYEPERHSYVAKAAMTPQDIGVIKIELTPRRTCQEGFDIFYIDIHASL